MRILSQSLQPEKQAAQRTRTTPRRSTSHLLQASLQRKPKARRRQKKELLLLLLLPLLQKAHRASMLVHHAKQP
jgi:hypothetical protein